MYLRPVRTILLLANSPEFHWTFKHKLLKILFWYFSVFDAAEVHLLGNFQIDIKLFPVTLFLLDPSHPWLISGNACISRGVLVYF
jgi:hypothetical protein